MMKRLILALLLCIGLAYGQGTQHDRVVSRGGVTLSQQVVTFSATPTFDVATSGYFRIMLTGNVTSSTISNAVTGKQIYIEVCQDATGGRTFVWAPTVGPPTPTIETAANACAINMLVFNGTNWEVPPGTASGGAGDTSNPVAADNIFYVKAGGNDTNDGLSWANAEATFTDPLTGVPAAGRVIYVDGALTPASDLFTSVTNPVHIIFMNGTLQANVALTFPANITLEFRKGALINAATGVTVQINGPYICPVNNQCFSRAGTGVVLVTARGNSGRYNIQHWGAVGNGSADDSGALTQAVTSCQASAGGGDVWVPPSPTSTNYRFFTLPTFSDPAVTNTCRLLLGNRIHTNGDLVIPPGWYIEGVVGGNAGTGAFMSDNHQVIGGETGTQTEAVLKLNAASSSSVKNIQVTFNGTSTKHAILILGGANIELRNVSAEVSAADVANYALAIDGPAQQIRIYNSVFTSGTQASSKHAIHVNGLAGQGSPGNIYIKDSVLRNKGILNESLGTSGFGGIVLENVLHEDVLAPTIEVDSTGTSGGGWTFINVGQSDLAGAAQPLWKHTVGAFPVFGLTFIMCAEPIGVGYYEDTLATALRIQDVVIWPSRNNGITLRPPNSRMRTTTLPLMGLGSSTVTATPSETLGTGLIGAQSNVAMQFPENVVATGFTTGGTLAAGNYFYIVTALNGVNAPFDAAFVSSGTPYESWISAEVTCNVASGTTGRCDLTWDTANGATSYRIYGRGAYTPNTGAHNKAIFFTSTTASFSDTGGAGTAGTPPRWDRESGNLPLHRLSATADNWFGGPKLLGIGTFAPAAKVHIVAPTASTVGQRIDLAATPSANAWEVRDSAAVVQASISSAFAATLQSLTLATSPLGLASGGTNRSSAWAASRCVQVNAGNTALEPASGACSTTVEDNISVNSVAATDANFINTAATGTVPSATWTLDTAPAPDTIAVAIGLASATEAGVVTTSTQTFAGAKTFNNNITAPALVSSSATPATVGVLRGASGDTLLAWRNNGDTANVTVSKTGAAGAAPADTITLTNAGGFQSPAFISTSSDPADAGILRLGNNEQACWESSPAGTDFCLQADTSEGLLYNSIPVSLSPRTGDEIWFVSTNGNDTTGDGKSWGTSFATLGKATTTAAAGAIIYVGSGAYAETSTLVIKANQTLSLSTGIVTLSGNPCMTVDDGSGFEMGGTQNAETTRIDCNGVANQTAIRSANQAVGSKNVVLRGFTLKAVGSTVGGTSRGIDHLGISHSRFEDLLVENFGSQLYCDNTSAVSSYYNHFENITFFGASKTGWTLLQSCNAQTGISLAFGTLATGMTIGSAGGTGGPNEFNCFRCTFETGGVAIDIIQGQSLNWYGGRFESNAGGALKTASTNLIRAVLLDAPYILSSGTPPVVDLAGAVKIRGGLGNELSVDRGLTTSAVNLAPNANFEGWSGTTVLPGWIDANLATWSGTGTLSTKETTVQCGTATQCTIHYGTASVKFGDGAAANKGVAWSSAIQIDPRKPYTLSYWWSTNNASASMRDMFRLKDSAGVTITTGTVIGLSATGDPGAESASNLDYSASFDAHITGADLSPASINVLERRTRILRFPAGVASVQFAIETRGTAGFFGFLDDMSFGEGAAVSRPQAAPIGDSGSGGTSNVYGNFTATGDISGRRSLVTGTAHVAGDYALSAGWGTSPTISPAAVDAAGRFTVTSGTGTPIANPTVILTFKNGTWTTSPSCPISRGDTNSPTADWRLTTITATAATWTFVGTPAVSTAYIGDFICLGKP